MRLAGGVPGTGHSVLRPGMTLPDCWVWDAHGEADVEDAIGQWVLSLAGRSGLHAGGTDAASPFEGPEEMNDDEDLRPLAHYTFEANAEPDPLGASEPGDAPPSDGKAAPPKAKPKRRR